MRKIFRKGLTLTELILVMVILGILASIAIPVISSNVNRAKRAEAIAVMGALRTAQKMYHTEQGAYATTLTALSPYIATADLAGKYYTGSSYSTDGIVISANGGVNLNVNMTIINGSVDNP